MPMYTKMKTHVYCRGFCRYGMIALFDTLIFTFLAYANLRRVEYEFVKGVEYMFTYGWPQVAYTRFSVVPLGKPGGVNYYALAYDIVFASGAMVICHWLFKKVVCRAKG